VYQHVHIKSLSLNCFTHLTVKAEIMVAFWNDLTHKNFGGRDQEAQPHGFADNLEMDHQGDDLAVGLEGDVIDRDGDIDMEQGRGERVGRMMRNLVFP
jgi:hypothetical protein